MAKQKPTQQTATERGSQTLATDKTASQRQIDATDQQIDRLVYKLYELTDQEIRIVEEGARS